MQNPIPYVAIGDIGIDIYPKIEKRFPGGMALNSAFHAQKAGLEASVVSAIGDDEDGAFIRNFLRENHISDEALEVIPGKTNNVEITLDENARPQYGTWNLGVLKNYRLTQRQKLFLQKQDIGIAVYLPELRGMFDDFAALKMPKMIKVGDFTDLSEFQGDQSVLNEYIDLFDIFVLSIDEKIDERVESFTAFLQKNTKMGIMLLGPRGSICIDRTGKIYSQSADVTRVIDTTGAGDAYLATFIGEYIYNKNIKRAMKKATNTATKAIRHLGAV